MVHHVLLDGATGDQNHPATLLPHRKLQPLHLQETSLGSPGDVLPGKKLIANLLHLTTLKNGGKVWVGRWSFLFGCVGMFSGFDGSWREGTVYRTLERYNSKHQTARGNVSFTSDQQTVFGKQSALTIISMLEKTRQFFLKNSQLGWPLSIWIRFGGLFHPCFRLPTSYAQVKFGSSPKKSKWRLNNTLHWAIYKTISQKINCKNTIYSTVVYFASSWPLGAISMNSHSPWKMLVGRRSFLSFWEGDSSGANC